MINRRFSKQLGNLLPKNLWSLAIVGVALVVGAGVLWSGTNSSFAEEGVDEVEIVVYKTPNCGCCHNWIAHLRNHGLKVAANDVATTQPIRTELGVPPAMTSCHTGFVDNYWIEGHVPADLVKRLLEEQPDDIRGIAVPGMPMGSPGMEGPNPVTYDVVAYHTDGTVSVYATRDGHTTPQ